jgi:hypothetical protein
MGRKKSPNSKDNTTFITSHIPGPATYILAFSFSPSSVLIVCIDANTHQQLYDWVYKEESSTTGRQFFYDSQSSQHSKTMQVQWQ